MRTIISALFIMFLSSEAFANDINLNLDAHKGKVIYVDFWASWCTPCRKSFPWMSNMHKAYAGNGLVVIAVNLDQERTLAERFIKEFSPEFTIIFDPNGTLASFYKIKGMPSAVIIGRDGNIRFKHTGFHRNKIALYEKELQCLLEEQ